MYRSCTNCSASCGTWIYANYPSVSVHARWQGISFPVCTSRTSGRCKECQCQWYPRVHNPCKDPRRSTFRAGKTSRWTFNLPVRTTRGWRSSTGTCWSMGSNGRSLQEIRRTLVDQCIDVWRWRIGEKWRFQRWLFPVSDIFFSANSIFFYNC